MLEITERVNLHSCEDFCKVMFIAWLETKAELTWNQLMDALKKPACELEAVADMIKESTLIEKG